MINSPDLDVGDIHTLIKTAKAYPGYVPGVSNEDEYKKKTERFIRGNSLCSYYVRMAWSRKMQFITDLVHRIRSLGTITLFLNTLHSVTGKITSYCLTSRTPPMVFDRVLADHDRMMDPEILVPTIHSDLQWYESLDDQEQVAYLMTLVRISSGGMIRILYCRLQETYNERIRHSSPLVKSSEEKDHEESVPVVPMEHNPDDPKHQKVLELEKQWNQTINKMKEDLAKRMPTSKQEKQGKSKKKGSMKSKDKKKKNKKKEDEDQMDWVQLMPIWIVKKIFSYLDKKTLTKAKKVNAYWKWAIEELAKDKKLRKMLDKSNKKLKAAAGGECTLPEDAMLETPKSRISHTQRRVKKLEQRGAILDKMRHCEAETTDTSCVMVEAFSVCDLPRFSGSISIYPRVVRMNPPLYKRPDCLFKDLNLICETRDDLSDSGCDLSRTVPHSSQTSLGSDEDILI